MLREFFNTGPLTKPDGPVGVAWPLNKNARCAEAVLQAYSFGETGPVQTDSGRYEAHLTPAGSTWRHNETVAGFGWRSSDSGSGYLVTAAKGARQYSGASPSWSREIMVVPHYVNFSHGLVGITEGAGFDRGLFITSGNKFKAHIYDGSDEVATGTTSVAVDRAYHVIVTVETGSMKLYVNGVLEATTTTNSNAGYGSFTNPTMQIGKGPMGVSGEANTSLATFLHVIEYNRILTAEEVQHRYLNPSEMWLDPSYEDSWVGAASSGGGGSVFNPYFYQHIAGIGA